MMIVSYALRFESGDFFQAEVHATTIDIADACILRAARGIVGAVLGKVEDVWRCNAVWGLHRDGPWSEEARTVGKLVHTRCVESEESLPVWAGCNRIGM